MRPPGTIKFLRTTEITRVKEPLLPLQSLVLSEVGLIEAFPRYFDMWDILIGKTTSPGQSEEIRSFSNLTFLDASLEYRTVWLDKHDADSLRADIIVSRLFNGAVQWG